MLGDGYVADRMMNRRVNEHWDRARAQRLAALAGGGQESSPQALAERARGVAGWALSFTGQRLGLAGSKLEAWARRVELPLNREPAASR
jgi:hypothetical protein